MTETDAPIVVRDNREPGWFWAPNELLDEHGPTIGAYGVATYMLLARRANNESQESWPGLRSMAKTLGTGRRQVREAIEKLEAAGIIAVEHRPRQTHRYTLLNIRGTKRAGTPETPPKEVAPLRPQVVSQGSHPGTPGEPELDLGTRLRELDLAAAAKKPKPRPSSSLPDQEGWTAEDHDSFNCVLYTWTNEFGNLSAGDVGKMIGLWNLYPRESIHLYAFQQMKQAKDKRGVRPNLAYYQKCLETEFRNGKWEVLEE